jgi:signal transduction histidine kinase
MALQTTPFTAPILLAGVAYAAFAVYLLRRPSHRKNRGSLIAAWLLLGLGVWLLSYAAQLSVTTLQAKLLFQRLKYVGPAAVPFLWFAYVLTYTGYGEALSRRTWTVLAVPPVLAFGLAVTYPATELMWSSVALRDAGGWIAFTAEHGIGFYALQVYIYVLFAASVWLLLRKLRSTSGVYRRQTLGLLVGALIPGVLGFVHVTAPNLVPNLDLPSVALAVTAVTVAWSVARDDLFTLEPVAWETAVQQLDDPVFVLDTDDRVVAANEAGKALTPEPVGTQAGDSLGRVLEEPVWTDVGDHECDGYTDDTHHVYDVSVSAVERDHTRLGRVVVVRDVTERHDREERLEEFATVVSHDLRNPLNVAVGHLELGQEAGDDAHFEEAEDALHRMEDIIDDLLTLARQGETELEREAVSLEVAARTAWSAVETADVTLHLAGERTVQADRTALLRLLENLFRNSVEHAGEGVTVTVGTTDSGFYVVDDGPGIPSDERDSVFEQGYTTSEDGTGFGLAIVEEVAEAHGWTISLAESDAGGARFEFDVE